MIIKKSLVNLMLILEYLLFEMGMQFTQEIEILKGDIVKDIVHKYNDYTWEVPFSNLGG